MVCWSWVGSTVVDVVSMSTVGAEWCFLAAPVIGFVIAATTKTLFCFFAVDVMTALLGGMSKSSTIETLIYWRHISEIDQIPEDVQSVHVVFDEIVGLWCCRHIHNSIAVLCIVHVCEGK